MTATDLILNKIRIRWTKKSNFDQNDPDLHLLSQFQYCCTFAGVGVFMIQYSIHNVFVLCVVKKKNLETENIF